MSDQESSSSLFEVIISSSTSETAAVFGSASLLCIAIAVAAIGKKTLLGLFFWPLSIISSIKIIVMPYDSGALSGLTNLVVRSVTDWMLFIVILITNIILYNDFMRLSIRDRKSFGMVYSFVLNFLWALKTDVLVRAVFLTAVTIYKVIHFWLQARSSEKSIIRSTDTNVKPKKK